MTSTATRPLFPQPATAGPALRDYQERAVRCTLSRVRRGRRRLYIELPTGTGKSVVLASIAKAALARGRVLAVAHRRELITQLAGTMEYVTGQAAGVVMAARDEVDAPILVGSIQTLQGRRLARVLDADREDITLLLIDEAHHATNRNAYAALIARLETAYPGVAVVGCTATPYRMDKHRMQDLLPTCAFARTLPDMQRDGWLCPLDWRPIVLDGFNLSDLPTTMLGDGEEDYAPHELAEELNQEDHVRAVVDSTATLISGRQTLVFGVNVAHAQALAEEYRARGFRAATIWGEMPAKDRTATLDAWRAGDIQVVSNCAVLTEGFDFPAISALVMARPTMSPGLYSQMLGRGTRTDAGKDDCLVLDVAGNADVSRTRAITLPVLLGEGIDVEEPARGPRVKGPMAGALSVRWITDPVNQSVCAWALDEQTGNYVTTLTEDTYAVLIAEPDGSGLFLPVVITKRQGVEPVTDEPCVFRDEVYQVNAMAIKSGLHVFADKNAPWRSRPASPAQIAALGRFSPKAAAAAAREEWDRGTVSMMLQNAIARRALGRYAHARRAS